MLLADVLSPEDEARAAAHGRELLTWGLALAVWFLFTGMAAVGGVAMLLRHAIDPPTERSRRLGLVAAGANGVLAASSVLVAFVMKGSPPFGGFSLDMHAAAWIFAVVQAGLAAGNVLLVRMRPVASEPDEPET